jgi:DNA-binding PadR family transcriptional regulator
MLLTTPAPTPDQKAHIVEILRKLDSSENLRLVDYHLQNTKHMWHLNKNFAVTSNTKVSAPICRMMLDLGYLQEYKKDHSGMWLKVGYKISERGRQVLKNLDTPPPIEEVKVPTEEPELVHLENPDNVLALLKSIPTPHLREILFNGLETYKDEQTDKIKKKEEEIQILQEKLKELNDIESQLLGGL